MFPKSKRPAPKPLSWRSLDAFCYFLLAISRHFILQSCRIYHILSISYFWVCYHVLYAQNPSSPPPADPHHPAYPHPASALPRPPLFLRPALKKISFFLPLATPQTPPPHPKPGPPPGPKRPPHPKSRRTLHRPGGSFFFLFPAHPAFFPSVRRFPLDLRIRFKQLEAALPLELAHRQQVCLARQILVEHLVPEADFVRVLARAAVVHHGDVGP